MPDQPWRIRTELIQGPPGPGKYLSASQAWTPGTIDAGASVSVAVTVATAAVGQSVIAPGFSLALAAGVLISAQVSSANTVTVTIFNASAARSLSGPEHFPFQ